MIVISSNPVLGAGPETVDARNPRIGWHNLVRADNIFSLEETVDEPSRNVANPTTYLKWRGETIADQWLMVTLDAAEDVDYFAIAKHNLGSSGAFIKFQSSTNGTDWFDVTALTGLNTDFVYIREFVPVFASYFRLWIEPGTVPPSVGVFYVGHILKLQRRIYVGHVPLTYGRVTSVSTGLSEVGEFLGRTKRREFLESSVDMQNIKPDWYRTEMEPFVEQAAVTPFFWAWRPGDYPFETGYAWLMGDVQPANQRPNGMMQFSFKMQGVR
jgi:hypothetical protein